MMDHYSATHLDQTKAMSESDDASGQANFVQICPFNYFM